MASGFCHSALQLRLRTSRRHLIEHLGCLVLNGFQGWVARAGVRWGTGSRKRAQPHVQHWNNIIQTSAAASPASAAWPQIQFSGSAGCSMPSTSGECCLYRSGYFSCPVRNRQSVGVPRGDSTEMTSGVESCMAPDRGAHHGELFINFRARQPNNGFWLLAWPLLRFISATAC